MIQKIVYRLRASEWFVTGGLFLFLFSLFLIAKIKTAQVGPFREHKIVLVDVAIQGHVKRCGTYSVERGMPIGAVLRKAAPKKFADLRAISLKSPITAPLELKIECLKNLLIRIEGAVQNPGTIQVLPGTRILDLRKIVPLSREADLTFFKKRHVLEDGETVFIPEKNSSSCRKSRAKL